MRHSPRILTVAILLVAAAFVAAGARTVPATQEQSADVRGLLEQRRDALEQVEEMLRQRFAAGTVELDEVVRGSIDLLRAELDLATSPEERVVLLERQLEQMRRLEHRIDAMADAGRATQLEVLRARVSRLEAEIELERAR